MRQAWLVPPVMAAVGFASPASATSAITCSSVDETVTVEMTVGNVPGLAIVGALVDVGDRSWTMGRPEGPPTLAVSQAFARGGHYWVDFTDANVNEIVAELRLHRADEGDNAAFGGTLRMPQVGAWTLLCAEG